MLKVLGIVSEYNPFHKGHLYHLTEAVHMVQPDFVIAVMSGNFTQRGEPAIIDKWTRTAMALKNGIDLVLELPTVYSCQTAELFSAAAVQILNSTGLVTHMAFGCEHNNIEDLNLLAKILDEEPAAYRDLLKLHLGKGLPFPQARANALKEYMVNETRNCMTSKPIDQILSGSNSILAIEYLKSLKKLKSSIQPVIIPRIGSSYNAINLEGQFSSATAIRRAVLSCKNWDEIIPALPGSSLKILKDAIRDGRGPVSLHSLEQMLLGIIRRAHIDEISQWMDVEEGLEHRIKKCALESRSIEEFLSKTKTKRYAYTRLQRIVIHGLLDIKTSDIANFQKLGGPRYIRILGFNTKAGKLLKRLKSTASLPIITKAAHYHRHNDEGIKAMFEREILATDLYTMAFPNPERRKGGQELTQNVVLI